LSSQTDLKNNELANVFLEIKVNFLLNKKEKRV